MGSEKLAILLRKLTILPVAMNRYGQQLMLRGDVQQLMKDANTDQLYSGLRSDGSTITPPYRPRTIAIKEATGRPTDRVTLYDTGDYYKGFRVKVYPNRAEMYNVDLKSDKLKEKYGVLIEGLAPFAIDRLREFLRPLFQAQARKHLTR